MDLYFVAFFSSSVYFGIFTFLDFFMDFAAIEFYGLAESYWFGNIPPWLHFFAGASMIAEIFLCKNDSVSAALMISIDSSICFSLSRTASC